MTLPDLPTMPPGARTAAVRSGNARHLTDAGRRISAAARELIPLLREEAAEGERLTYLTPRTLDALAGAGVFQMSRPIEWGGLALGARDLTEVIATVSEGDGSAGWIAFTGVGLRNAMILDDEAIDEIAANAATHESLLLCGASVYATRVGDARKIGGGWMVKGDWAFGSGCRHAPFAVVGVNFDRSLGSGRGICLLDRPQYEIKDDWHVMGLSASSSNGLRIAEEVFVPDHRFVDTAQVPARMDAICTRFAGAAFQQGGPALLLVVTLSSVAITLGMARGAIEEFVAQAAKRRPFNLPYERVADMPTVHAAVGRARAMIDSAAAVIEGWADEIDERGEQGVPFRFEEESQISLNLAYASNLCEEAIKLLLDTIGSSAITLNNPIQRFFRDARVINSHGALRLEPQAEIVGRVAVGLPPFLMMGGAVPDVSAAGLPPLPPL